MIVGTKSGLLALALVVLSACESQLQKTSYAGRALPLTEGEVTFVKSFLSDLQSRSISQNREYCGYFVVNSDGNLTTTPPLRGREAGCRPADAERGLKILASYHTHAAYAPDFDSELPSSDDLRADIFEGIDGYISTPGGRVWYISAEQRNATLLCGENCVVSDPNYKPETEYSVADSYDLATLEAREQGNHVLQKNQQ